MHYSSLSLNHLRNHNWPSPSPSPSLFLHRYKNSTKPHHIGAPPNSNAVLHCSPPHHHHCQSLKQTFPHINAANTTNQHLLTYHCSPTTLASSVTNILLFNNNKAQTFNFKLLYFFKKREKTQTKKQKRWRRRQNRQLKGDNVDGYDAMVEEEEGMVEAHRAKEEGETNTEANRRLRSKGRTTRQNWKATQRQKRYGKVDLKGELMTQDEAVRRDKSRRRTDDAKVKAALQGKFGKGHTSGGGGGGLKADPEEDLEGRRRRCGNGMWRQQRRPWRVNEEMTMVVLLCRFWLWERLETHRDPEVNASDGGGARLVVDSWFRMSEVPSTSDGGGGCHLQRHSDALVRICAGGEGMMCECDVPWGESQSPPYIHVSSGPLQWPGPYPQERCPSAVCKPYGTRVRVGRKADYMAGENSGRVDPREFGPGRNSAPDASAMAVGAIGGA
ncbi:uncharacterized protein DS421_12g379270 [Arachis hypogaea]|nr:uncharacterized protein DS421_12g379270 [Arachis hypogaea]